MKTFIKIKQWLLVALHCAALGAALSGGAAYAADVAQAAPAAATASANDLVLNGDAKCTRCHDEADSPELLAIGKTKHGVRADGRTPSCTSCHGESQPHQAQKGKVAPDVVFKKGAYAVSEPAKLNEACLSCHDKDAKRSHWEGSVHQSRDVACSSCHQVHTAQDKVRDKLTQPEVCFACHKEQRTQINKPSRHPIPEGKMSCSDCHNPHGSVGPKLMKRDSVVETCYTCHMEKRGPFVHNHEPVSEDCSNCHNPHGTVVESLLKARPPFLCQQCHTPHGPFIPQLLGQQAVPNTATQSARSTTNLTQGRSCLNCHTQVHGTNNPANTNPTPQFNFR
ncbi:MAG: cytochrome C [Burkholderiales bacterium RIFCSPHIGHO2_12_FULL_61_11]|nr:MAG: cytochrome C [Burkholderiales bacterium RIFCSPHIGHO2_12_FULL_61_11]